MIGALVTWLRAQLDVDERAAREATPGPWRVSAFSTSGLADVEGVTSAFGDYCCSREDAEHMARWDPARVLAEVAAKRRVLDQHDAMVAAVQAAEGTLLAGAAKVRLGAYRFAAQCIALPYADRPGYREEWRP